MTDELMVTVEHVGPKAAMVYCESWSPRRFRLVSRSALPQDAKGGDKAVLLIGADLTRSEKRGRINAL